MPLDAEMLGDFGGVWCAAKFLGKVCPGLGELRLNVFDAAGHVDGPPVVSEVSADLAHHGRHGERYEFGPMVGVEAVDGAD